MDFHLLSFEKHSLKQTIKLCFKGYIAECCVPSWLELPRLAALLYIAVHLILHQINESLRMGALLWVNVERAPNPSFGRLVRCLICPWALSCKTMVHIDIPHCFSSLLQGEYHRPTYVCEVEQCTSRISLHPGVVNPSEFQKGGNSSLLHYLNLVGLCKENTSLIFKLTTIS